MVTILLTAFVLFFFNPTQGVLGFLTNLATAMVSFADAPPIMIEQIPQFWFTSVTTFVGIFFLALSVFILGRKVER